jgi:hypothetical protein
MVGPLTADRSQNRASNGGQIHQAALSAMDLTDVLMLFIGYRLKFWTNLQSFDNFGRG